MTNLDRSNSVDDDIETRTAEVTIPMIEEQLAVDIRTRTTGVVRLESTMKSELRL